MRPPTTLDSRSRQQAEMEQESMGRHHRSARLKLLRRLQEDAACLATRLGGVSSLDVMPTGTDRHCSACESRVVLEALSIEEIRHAANSWAERQAHHEKTMKSLERFLNRPENSKNQCDHVDGGQFTLSEESLTGSPSSSRSKEESRRARISCGGPELRDSRLRQKSLHFALMVKRHEELGRKLRTELDRYSTWLESRAQNLQRNYERYCEIMVERCQSPLVLYEDSEDLARAKEEFLVATSDREQAAREAEDSAYADGRSDLLRDLYCLRQDE